MNFKKCKNRIIPVKGSVSVALLSSMGYEVIAMSGKTDNPMLTQLGAAKVVARADFEDKARPLNRENYAGAVDVAGGNILANILSMTKAQGKLKELLSTKMIVISCIIIFPEDLPIFKFKDHNFKIYIGKRYYFLNKT